MIKYEKIILKIVVTALILSTILICGCTTGAGGGSGIADDDHTPASSDSTVEGTEQAQDEQADNIVSVSWRDFYPDYSEQEKTELMDKAKDYVMQVLPDVDRSSLNGYWQDWRDKGYGTPNYGPPTIVFKKVDDTSSKYEENYRKSNIVTIEVDPVTMEIIAYAPTGYSPPHGFMNMNKLSLDEGIERGLQFIESIKGEGFFEDNSDTLIIDKTDRYDDYESGLVPVSIQGSYKNIPYFYDGIYILYDVYSDKVDYYGDDYADREFIQALTTLSPVPDISLDEAKQIFVDKVKERYPGDDLQISFDVTYMKYEDSLVWLDDPVDVYEDNPEPVPLMWHLTFNDKYDRKNGPDNRRSAFVDAHTGEVIGYKYRDPR